MFKSLLFGLLSLLCIIYWVGGCSNGSCSVPENIEELIIEDSHRGINASETVQPRRPHRSLMDDVFSATCPRECEDEPFQVCENLSALVFGIDTTDYGDSKSLSSQGVDSQAHLNTTSSPGPGFEGWIEEVLKKEGENQSISKHKKQSKGSGTRCNFASIDCGAKIVDVTKDSKSPKSILKDNKDEYLLFKCQSDKFVVIELCEEILVESFEIANFEFFSSMFKDFKLSVIDHYPSGRWRSLGDFRANNSRSVQHFEVSDSKIWSKFLKIEFKSHYGDEFFCPISYIRVYGTTMIQEFKVDMAEKTHHQTTSLSQVLKKVESMTENSSRISSAILINETTNTVSFMTSSQNSSDSANEPSSPVNGPYAVVTSSDSSNGALVALPNRLAEFELLGSTEDSSSQESVFKMIANRLNLIELNSSLARRYFDEKLLKLNDFLFDLNRTVKIGLELASLQTQNEKLELSMLNATFLEYMKHLRYLVTEVEHKMSVVHSYIYIQCFIQLAHTLAIVALFLYVTGRFQRRLLFYINQDIIRKLKTTIHNRLACWFGPTHNQVRPNSFMSRFKGSPTSSRSNHTGEGSFSALNTDENYDSKKDSDVSPATSVGTSSANPLSRESSSRLRILSDS